MATAVQLPQVQAPNGAHEVTERVDVGTPDTHRTFTEPWREANPYCRNESSVDK